MSLSQLTWLNPATTTISVAGATASYAQWINALETQINASTYWNCVKSLDAGNTRGYIQLKPKSATAGITQGRCLIILNDGTVGAASPNEKPSVQFRQAPYATATTTLTPRMWAGFSPNANTSSGPTNDPFGTGASQPYTGGSTVWSKFLPINVSRPSPNRKLGIIQSAQIICVYWQIDSANAISYLIFGKLLENGAGDTAKWGLCCSGTDAQTTAVSSTYSWNSTRHIITATNTQLYSPFSSGYIQHSAGTATRGWAIAQDNDGTLYGFGRTLAVSLSSSANQDSTYNNTSQFYLQQILVSGGVYTGGSTDTTLGRIRQIRFGPPANRSQSIFDNSSVKHAICLHWDSSTSTRCPMWFHNYQ